MFSIFVAWCLFKPHILPDYALPFSKEAYNLELLLDRKNRQLQVLKDLELDYHTKKISDADYQQMKLSLSRELAAILKTIDELPQSSR